MSKNNKRTGAPTGAQQLLSSIGVESEATRKAHMISEIGSMLSKCNELVTGVARSTGHVLNDPDLRAIMSADAANELVTLASNLHRDSVTLANQLAPLAVDSEQLSKITDWPDFLAKGLTLTEALAQWQLSYANVVLPIKDQIDTKVRSIISEYRGAKDV